MQKYIEAFLEEFDYPLDSREVLAAAYDVISKNAEASDLFNRALSEYKKNINCDYGAYLDECKVISEDINLHEYTVKFLFFICLSRELRNHYKNNEYSDEMYHSAMLDLKYKLIECKLVKGINGSFVANWFSGFFNLTRFAFKRLQFEVKGAKIDHKSGDKSIKAGDPIIVIHIPRTGTPLSPTECDEDFNKAKEFFKDSFTDTPIAFSCHSWLVYEKLREFLSDKSNIIAFMNRFEICYTDFHDLGNYSQVWRLFDVDYNGDLNDLPEDSSLRRAFKKYLIDGGKWGAGYGIFFY